MNKALRNLLFLYLGVCFSLNAWAGGTYDLDACYQAAQKNNESLSLQEENLVQAGEHYHQASGTLYPYIFGYASYFKQEDTGAQSASSAASDQHLAKLGLIQPLFRGFSEYAALSRARDLEQAEREGLASARLALYLNLIPSYYSVLAQQKDLEHLDTQIGLYEKRIADLKARVAIGRSRSSEVLMVQAALGGLHAQRQQIAGQLQIARNTLAFLTGLESNAVLEDPSPWPTALEARETALARFKDRSEVRQALQEVEAVRENLTILRGGHWPSLDLTGNYYLDRTGSLSEVNWDAQLALTMPLFAGGVTVSKVAEVESQLKQATLALSLVKRQIQLEIANAYDLLQSDLTQVAALQAAADLGEKNYRAVLQDYNYSLVTNLDVVQALSSYQDNLRALDRLKFSVLADARRLEAVTAQKPEPQGGQ